MFKNISKQPHHLVNSIVVASLFALSGCQTSVNTSNSTNTHKESKVNASARPSTTLFTPTVGILPAEPRARRKWDGAIVGDLDGNGFQDLLLTEHAHKVFIYWNEGGHFSAGQELISGDMHGTAIADFDKDGLVEIIIAQGGGNGSNPRKPKHYEVTKDRKFTGGQALTHFEKGRGRSVKVLDANNDGNLDLFLTGFATPEQFKMGANHLYQNTGAGQFVFESNLPKAQRLSYRSAIVDFNNDGESDVVVFGGHDIMVAQGGKDFQFVEASNQVLGELKKTSDVSALSQLDFDGDGDMDWVLSRAEHQFEHETYYDPATKRFAFFARFQPFQTEDLTINGDFILENLQMAYPHFDVFVGQDKRLIDFKDQAIQKSYDWDRSASNQLRLTAAEAEGWPKNLCVKGRKMKKLPKNSKPGLYIGHIGKGVWRICSQSSSATAGVVNNVISSPANSKNPPLPAKLLENRNGVMVDVSKQMGIDINEQTTSVVAADFNNDGWTDLFFMRYGNMAKQITQYLYLNNAGKSFTLMKNHGVVSTDLGATGAGAEVIDYDKDGDVDLIIANERGKWHLFENHTNAMQGNNFVGITVGISPSGKAGTFGATASLTACGRTQTRSVGNTASSFAVTFNNDLLFGLGACTQVDDLRITWTNGESKQVQDIQNNQYKAY